MKPDSISDASHHEAKMSISSTAHGPSDWHPLPIVNSIQGEQYRHVFRHGSSCVRNGLPSWQPLWIRNLDMEHSDNTHRTVPVLIPVRWSDNWAQTALYCSYFNRLLSTVLHTSSRNTHEGKIAYSLKRPTDTSMDGWRTRFVRNP
jgi:hypothetical protein